MMKDSDTSKNLYYIYIDTKIRGAIEQLLGYFRSNVFHNQACIAVYVKHYKENQKLISELFDANNISYRFIKRYSDISFIDGKVVFYLFNAQSNCRMVAFRNVSHVFITHGESNKKSSVKPIIRIYDHVMTSGQVGIDRYLKAGLFTESDIENNRVIRLGSTFVGQNNYSYKKESRTLLYAPTWEGGVPDENFSSISKNIHKLLLETIKDKGIKKLVIQTHPNLGHRDESYKRSLKLLLAKLVKQNISVFLVKNKISVRDRIQAFYGGFRYISSSKEIHVSHAITDISAMEVQLLVKNIPTMVLANRYIYEGLIIPSKMNLYYSNTMVFLDEKGTNPMCFYSPESTLSYIESYQENSLKDLTLSKRVEWLCQYVNKEKMVQAKLKKNI